MTFITNSSQKFDCPLIAEKKTNVSIIPTGQGMKQILGLCKEQNRVTKEVIIKDTADMLICHGKKGRCDGGYSCWVFAHGWDLSFAESEWARVLLFITKVFGKRAKKWEIDT